MSEPTAIRVGIVGARGHVGAELIRLIAAHPRFELAYVGSRELAGQRVADHSDAYDGELRYTSPTNAELPTLGADAVVLALPNSKAADCVVAFRALAQGQFGRFGQGPRANTLSGDFAHTIPYGLMSPAQMFAMKVTSALVNA